MLITRQFFLFFVLVFLSKFGVAFNTGPMQLLVVGEAYTLDGSQWLYRELHYYSDDKLDHRVVYQNELEETIAEKALDYRKGLSTPAFVQDEFLVSQRLAVTRQEEKLILEVVSQGQSRSKDLPVKTPLVIDAGFDHFVREHWAAMVEEQQTRDFHYPVPSRLDVLKLQLTRTSCEVGISDDQREIICFTIKPAGWLLGLLLDPIKLSYYRDTQRLYRFRGLANLNDSQGKGISADIKYCYPQHHTGRCDEE